MSPKQLSIFFFIFTKSRLSPWLNDSKKIIILAKSAFKSVNELVFSRIKRLSNCCQWYNHLPFFNVYTNKLAFPHYLLRFIQLKALWSFMLFFFVFRSLSFSNIEVLSICESQSNNPWVNSYMPPQPVK